MLPRLPGSDATYRARLAPALGRLLIAVAALVGRQALRHRVASAIVLGVLLLRFAGCAGAPRRIPPETPDDGPRIGFQQRGIASWYGPGFHGRKTANGETYDMEEMTAAHRTLAFGSVVEVENLDNGRRTRVRINDRGPFIHGRIIDLSRAAARDIGMIGPGTAQVRIRVVDWRDGASRHLRSRPVRTAKRDQLWWVQAGAFYEEGRARDLANRLGREYPGVRVSKAGAWHRVLLGPYELRDAADDVAAALLRDGFDVILRPAD